MTKQIVVLRRPGVQSLQQQTCSKTWHFNLGTISHSRRVGLQVVGEGELTVALVQEWILNCVRVVYDIAESIVVVLVSGLMARVSLLRHLGQLVNNIQLEASICQFADASG